MRMSQRLPLLVPLLAAAVALSVLCSGCLITSDTEQHRSGNYVADSTFSQIQPGRTTVGWVRATLGPPTTIESLEDGTQIWKYVYTERRESSGAVFLIFGGHDANETNHTAFVEIRNGLVVKAWRG
jgi:outer membrane protein assembly factor BamE (lipoprotein component of BamABCDE complex)